MIYVNTNILNTEKRRENCLVNIAQEPFQKRITSKSTQIICTSTILQKESVTNVSDFLHGGGDFLELSCNLARHEKLCALEALTERKK